MKELTDDEDETSSSPKDRRWRKRRMWRMSPWQPYPVVFAARAGVYAD
jgi:hypothetical protein